MIMMMQFSVMMMMISHDKFSIADSMNLISGHELQSIVSRVADSLCEINARAPSIY